LAQAIRLAVFLLSGVNFELYGKSRERHMKVNFAVVSTLVLTMGSSFAVANSDPLEPINRGVFVFNEQVDKYLAKPAAQVYDKVTPKPVSTAVTDFFHNLTAPITIVNLYLQWRPHDATTQLARFMFNSTLGVAGIVDVGTPMGLPREKTDLGITLGKYGVASGPYLMLPLLGPSSFRDFPARIVDSAADPRAYVNDTARFSMLALDVVDTRARFLPLESSIIGDRYTFIRNAYLQQRAFTISGGVVEQDEFLDDSLDFDEQNQGSF
jgi:phospholipid-binding lipoprotein MlaA